MLVGGAKLDVVVAKNTQRGTVEIVVLPRS
jgi:hypothetical protein